MMLMDKKLNRCSVIRRHPKLLRVVEYPVPGSDFSANLHNGKVLQCTHFLIGQTYLSF